MAPPPFALEMKTIPDDFHWKAKYYHLTYKYHLDKDMVLDAVRQATSTPLMGWSVVHEESASGYEHTHAALMFTSKLGLRGARKFDIECLVDNHTTGQMNVPTVVHPNIMPKVNITQMEQIFLYYHQGHKYDPDTRKLVYSEPIKVEQHLPIEFEWSRAILEDIIAAPNLTEAAIAGCVRPRSISDIKALRAEGEPPKKFIHKFDPSTFKTLVGGLDWNALFIWGGSGLGKTKWALAQFKNPLIIKPFSSIGCLEVMCKKYDPKFHDGIVLDEANLNFMSREQVIALIDADEPCVMDARFFADDKLPADAKKIFVSNLPFEKVFPLDPPCAIKRRLTIVNVTQQTWKDPPYAPAALASPAAPAGLFGTPPIAPAGP